VPKRTVRHGRPVAQDETRGLRIEGSGHNRPRCEKHPHARGLPAGKQHRNRNAATRWANAVRALGAPAKVTEWKATQSRHHLLLSSYSPFDVLGLHRHSELKLLPSSLTLLDPGHIQLVFRFLDRKSAEPLHFPSNQLLPSMFWVPLR